MKYNTFWPRFFAGWIDYFVLLPLDWIDSWAFAPNQPIPLIIVWSLISYPVYWLYSVLMHGFYGQTVGKMVCKVKVMDISEKPMSMPQAFLRDSVHIGTNTLGLILFLYVRLVGELSESTIVKLAVYIIVFGSFGWFLIEVITMLTNKKRRALHDIIAGTVVVRTRFVESEEVHEKEIEGQPHEA